jgi:diadenosine tetraphosphate (Ap4A) HIT family hydrolase
MLLPEDRYLLNGIWTVTILNNFLRVRFCATCHFKPLPAQLIAGFLRAVGAVARRLGLDRSGYRLIANTSGDGHQEVMHFHVHIFAGRPLGPMLKGPAG